MWRRFETPTGNNNLTDISLVLPAWNESSIIAHSLRTVLDFADKNKWNIEVIVVDDGSVDDTMQRAESVEDNRIRVIRYELNRGKGYAVRTGMLAAKGRKRVFTDSDIPYRLTDLAAVVAELDRFSVVIGDRTLETSRYRQEISLLRNIASSAFEFVTSRLITKDLRDTQCGLKGFRDDAAKGIFIRTRFEHFGFDVEVLFLALKRGFQIGRVPVVLERNIKSSVRVFRDSVFMLRDLLRPKYWDIRGMYN